MQFKIGLSALLLFLFTTSAQAIPENYAELEYSHSGLNNGFTDWNDINLLNYFGIGAERFVVETDYKSHFGESAGVLGVNYTHTYNELWYQDFATSFSTDSAILPGFVIFSEIHRKLLLDQSLIAGLGIGHNVSQEPYSDNYGLAELQYYLTDRLSLQGGARINRSSPGTVVTARGFLGANYTNDHWDGYVRYEAGREGYTVVGENEFKNEFESQEETLQVHYWFKKGFGLGGRVDFYQSSFYDRNEIALDFLVKY
jgi:YaiO family outer membrane protein